MTYADQLKSLANAGRLVNEYLDQYKVSDLDPMERAVTLVVFGRFIGAYNRLVGL